MKDWYVDKGLSTLIRQIKERFPGVVIYTIGDQKHAARKSHHNPEADGSVDAADIMLGKKFSASDAEWLFNRLITIKDRRFLTAIYNRRIVSSEVKPWIVRTYNEDDPHTDHVHIDVNDLHENDGSDWNMAEKTRKKDLELDGFALPTVRYGENDNEYDGWNLIGRVQRIVGVPADGVYGAETANAVKKYLGKGDGKIIDGSAWVSLYGLSRVG